MSASSEKYLHWELPKPRRQAKAIWCYGPIAELPVMFSLVLALVMTQQSAPQDASYAESVTCATATAAHARALTGDELARMTRASQGWAVYLRQIWDPNEVPMQQLQADVQAASEVHATMLIDEPGRLFQIAVGCYDRIVAIAAAQQAQAAQ
jgi:hypothetical protein